MENAIKSAGICCAHGLDFPIRIVRTMPFTSDKNPDLYYSKDGKVRGARSTQRRLKDKAPLSCHRDDLENEMGELYDVYRWFAAYHDHIVEVDQGLGLSPPWGGMGNLKTPWFDGIREAKKAGKGQDFVITKGRGEVTYNPA
jgi:hypothetical protein